MTGPIQLFKNALAIVSANLFLFLSILLIPIIVTFITALFAPNPATGVMVTSESLIYMVLSLISVVVSILMSVALILAINDSSITAKEAYVRAMPYFWHYIGLSIVMTLILLVGFLLFIIPGIILSVWFAFASYVLVLENGGIIESLKRSREYVRGKWMDIFGRLIAMTAIIMLIAMFISFVAAVILDSIIIDAIVSALMLFLAPVAMAYIYLLYNEVKAVPASPVATTPSPMSTVAQ